MAARIEAAVALTSRGPRKPAARRLADTAAGACLTYAGRQPSDVDMLINTGLYREDNMGEPALAALVQEDIGASPGHLPAGGHGTFSFDLLNGTCGVLNAIQLEAGMLRSGVIGLGAVVASDVDPDGNARRPAMFQPAGGALLLGWDDSADGFTDFGAETFPEYADLFVSGLVWQEERRPGRRPGGRRRPRGRSRMVVDTRPGYHGRLVDCAEESAWRFLHRRGMEPGDIDLLVLAPAGPDFCDPLRIRLGIPGDRVAYVSEELENAYTTGPIAALQAAIRSGRLAEARTTLLLAAGAGITVTMALYRQAQGC